MFMASSQLVHNLLTPCSCLVHDLLITCSQLVHDLLTIYSRLVQGLFTTYSGLVYNFLQNFRNLFMTCSFEHYFFKTCSLFFLWLVYNLFITCSWLVKYFSHFFHNLFMTCSGQLYHIILRLVQEFIIHNCPRLVQDLFTPCSKLFEACLQLVPELFMTSWKTCSQFFPN